MKKILLLIVLLPLIGISQNVDLSDGNRAFTTGKVKITNFARLGAYVPIDSTLTTTVLADTWTFLGAGNNSQFINILSSTDFSFSGDTLVYIGTETIILHVEYGGTVSCSSPAETVHCAIFINDTEQEQLTGGTLCKNAGEVYAIAGISNLMQVSTNDKIKIMIKGDSPTVITNNHFSVSAFEVF